MQVHERGKALNVVFFRAPTSIRGVHLLSNPRYARSPRDFERSFALEGAQLRRSSWRHGDFYGMKDKYARLRDGAQPKSVHRPEGYRRTSTLRTKRFRAELERETER